jgi:2'-5' RNA ligase
VKPPCLTGGWRRQKAFGYAEAGRRLSAMVFLAGQSAVIIPVPEVESVVGGWRARFDLAAAVGVPAHVTVVYPFLPVAALTEPVVDELRAIVAHRAAFEVRFARCDRFPGVLFLAPAPDEPFRRLTAELVHRWPEAPPYGGEFADPVPHLTVAHVATPTELDEAERDVAARLPIAATVEAAWLIVFDGELWRPRAVLPLGPATPHGP